MNFKYQFDEYNTRRFGEPWGAKITFKGVKPQYEFTGHVMADKGDEGCVAIEAEVGDIIVFGHKDFRSNKSWKEWGIVSEGGELIETTQQGAFDHYNSKKDSNPLADFSDGNLLAELKRRGLNDRF